MTVRHSGMTMLLYMVIMSDCHLLVDRLCGDCTSQWYDYVTIYGYYVRLSSIS